MDKRTRIIAALVVLCGLAGSVVYAVRGAHDHFGCHSHGAVHHCH